MINGGLLYYNYSLKYIILGDAAVGKSDILRTIQKRQFILEYPQTMEDELAVRNVNIRNKTYRIQIWDTTGQENFRAITKAYYKNSVYALIVYDISNRDSFNKVSTWIKISKKSPLNLF